jgi:hypothetical protein
MINDYMVKKAEKSKRKARDWFGDAVSFALFIVWAMVLGGMSGLAYNAIFG